MSGKGCRVYIGNLPKDCRERDVEKAFKTFGRLRDILVKTGYGFVEFDDHRDADDAVYDMNGRELLGERITVEMARGTRRERSKDRRRGRLDKYGPPMRTKYRVIIENLSTRVSWQDLKDLMRRAGEVCYADAHKDRQNEGVIEFLTRSDMRRAIEKYDGHEMNGRKIKMVDDSGTGKSRSRSDSRSKSRSRSGRSRSRSHSRRRKSSRSRSTSRGDKRERKSSKSRSRSKSRGDKRRKSSKSRSRDDEKRKSKSKSRGKSSSKAKARSKSRSESKSKSRSSGGARENGDKSDAD